MMEEEEAQTCTLTRRNSKKFKIQNVNNGDAGNTENNESRRNSVDKIVVDNSATPFGEMKPLKKSKPNSSVKINFMGKPMVNRT